MQGAEITVEELCSRMDMSRREVNFYLKQLKVHGYIIREKVTSTGHQKDGSGSGISLTEFGKITGEEFQYRHEILTQFLQFVGVSDEKAQEDACRMEHVVSEETVQQICNFVDYGDTFERIFEAFGSAQLVSDGKVYVSYGNLSDRENMSKKICQGV